jgi:hypothetical protein
MSCYDLHNSKRMLFVARVVKIYLQKVNIQRCDKENMTKNNYPVRYKEFR